MFPRCLLAGFGLVMIGLFVGCETTDYEPLRFKKEIKDLKSEVAELRSEVEALKQLGVAAVPVAEPAVTKEPSTSQAPVMMPDPVQPARKTLSLDEEQKVIAELERIDVFFDFDDDGYAFAFRFGGDCFERFD